MNSFKFEIIHQSKKSRARVGKIYTPHGIIETPNFVAVGTNATLKALDTTAVDELGLQLMFCNTYHLIIQPGVDTVQNAGGLHKFMNRKGPLITDSGGFQIFSLAYGSVKDELKSKGQKKHGNSILSISEEGVLFRSYRDGQKILLTPETSVQSQKKLGADIIIPLDELPPYHTTRTRLQQSLERTHRWETRSLNEHIKNPNNQAMYAVIHGGIDRTLRKRSIDYLTAQPFDGFAIGGSLGKNHQELFDLVSFITPQLPSNTPNHLLGIGDLTSIEPCIKQGIDTFDSSYPTRCARHGLFFATKENVKIVQSIHKNSLISIDQNCACFTCTHYTRAYLHHLFKAKELSGYRLATIHNVFFMIHLMKRIKINILENNI